MNKTVTDFGDIYTDIPPDATPLFVFEVRKHLTRRSAVADKLRATRACELSIIVRPSVTHKYFIETAKRIKLFTVG